MQRHASIPSAKIALLVAASLVTAASLAAPVAAETSKASSSSLYQQPRATSGSQRGSSEFDLFAPALDRTEHTIDYAYWDEALTWMVVPMGPSVREGAPRVSPEIGTRIVYGHQSRYRLEGNRIAFSFLPPQVKRDLTEYRQDLESVGNTLNIAELPRNEQLAFWINLHNVAVIEAISNEYPIRSPSKAKFGPDKVALQDAKLVTIRGVALSPRDIREKIVYPNWSDPRVIYGFWRGEIGGPSIQRYAFTGQNVDTLLSLGAEEFVNSLRGIESFGGALRVSQIYEEAQPYYFGSDEDLRGHLAAFARDDVKALINEKDRIAYNSYESAIADLVYGKSDPGIAPVCRFGGGGRVLPDFTAGFSILTNCTIQPGVTDRAALRLMKERKLKLAKANRRGIRTGSVIVGGAEGESEGVKEVE